MLQALLSGGPTSRAVRDFSEAPLCGEWLLEPADGASPAALWWQQQVAAEDDLLTLVARDQAEACWGVIEAGGPIGTALLGSKPQLRSLLEHSRASKHCLQLLRAGGPGGEHLLGKRWVLKHMAAEWPKEGRQLLSEPAGGAFLQALLREQLWVPDFLGVLPAYDRSGGLHCSAVQDLAGRMPCLLRQRLPPCTCKAACAASNSSPPVPCD